MNESDVFALYERLYFHEIERRSAIDARANLPLALLLAQSGLLAYLLNKAPLTLESGASQTFWMSVCDRCALHGCGCMVLHPRSCSIHGQTLADCQCDRNLSAEIDRIIWPV